MPIRHIKEPLSSLSVFLLALHLFLLFSINVFSGKPVLAKTSYIKPSAEISVRSGQGTDYKIIAMVKDGVAVELIEVDASYAKVRLANGKEGWMLKRFLSDEPPLKDVVTALRSEKEQLQQRESDNLQKIKALSSTLAQTETKLDSVVAERDQIRIAYQTLQQDTADVVQMKKDLQQTKNENKLLGQELVTVAQENSSIKKENAIKWFLSGGGVLLVGMLIGIIFSQSRRRKSSLL